MQHSAGQQQPSDGELSTMAVFSTANGMRGIDPGPMFARAGCSVGLGSGPPGPGHALSPRRRKRLPPRRRPCRQVSDNWCPPVSQ